jgi:dimethylaniline monooxygenase (N-oxide forming)
MRIAVVGAGPAGLTSAKQALAQGHHVVVYEQHVAVGGIWNPGSGGAYPSVRMQSSRMSFPFSDFAPQAPDDFHSLRQVHEYLTSYAAAFGVLDVTRLRHRVVRVARKDGGGWQVTACPVGPVDTASTAVTEDYDAVMVAPGELWRARRPAGAPTGTRTLTAKDYRGPEEFRGQRVLVVGGGVSGADIASEISDHAAAVDWSVRRRALFLPRHCGSAFNDALFSYAGRLALEQVPYATYLGWLDRLLPEYMRAYRATGLLPEAGFHGAVHVNDTIIPLVHRGVVRVRPAFTGHMGDEVRFADGSSGRYQTVIYCLGYEMPDYGYIEGLRACDLYEHHFWRHDPTLAIINTPVDGEGFGTACPYFEAIAGWVLAVLAGKAALPGAQERADWCEEHMRHLDDKRYLDCWLETIRIGLLSGALPDPDTAFADYWALISGQVNPASLRAAEVIACPAECDALLDLTAIRYRVLAGLSAKARQSLLVNGQITQSDATAAAATPPGLALHPSLPYRQRQSHVSVTAQ